MLQKNNYSVGDTIWFVIQTKGTKKVDTYTFVLESKIDSINNTEIICGRWSLNKNEVFNSEELAVKEAHRKIGELDD